MAITHTIAAGMGGIRTTGDLVARVQMAKALKIKDAKEYVASKLGISSFELTDEAIVREIRGDLNLGLIYGLDGFAKGIEAKFRISKLLGLEIKSVSNFIQKSGIN